MNEWCKQIQRRSEHVHLNDLCVLSCHVRALFHFILLYFFYSFCSKLCADCANKKQILYISLSFRINRFFLILTHSSPCMSKSSWLNDVSQKTNGINLTQDLSEEMNLTSVDWNNIYRNEFSKSLNKWQRLEKWRWHKPKKSWTNKFCHEFGKHALLIVGLVWVVFFIIIIVSSTTRKYG